MAAALWLAGAAQARADAWTRPFRLAGPESLDVAPSQIAFSPDNAGAVAFGTFDEDHPAIAHAYAVLRSPSGRLGTPRRVPGAQQVLDLAFAGATVYLLTGSSPTGQPCCGTVQVVPLEGASFGRARTVIRGAGGAGPGLGRLVVLPGSRLLAAVATPEGVWVSQAGGGSRFPAPRRISGAVVPEALDATSLPGGATVVTWTAASGQPAGAPARTIFTATGTPDRAPGGAHAALTVPAGHEIDGLALTGSSRGATVALAESWFDRSGIYHSQVAIADLTPKARARAFPIPGELAGDPALAADPAGDLVLAWKACDQNGECAVYVASRKAGRRIGRPQRLGPIDASQDPAAAVAHGGRALVGWIEGGHVLAADRRSAAGRFAAPRTVSATTLAADLSIAFAPDGQALATWTQGALAPSVMGALHLGP